MQIQPKRILIIDDVSTDRLYLKKIVETFGHEVIEASGGKAGEELAVRAKPDLIFMDIVMPEMSGFEATRNLKKNPNTKGIPVVMITSKNSRGDRINSTDNGSCGYVVKPANSVAMRAVFEKVFS